MVLSRKPILNKIPAMSRKADLKRQVELSLLSGIVERKNHGVKTWATIQLSTATIIIQFRT